MKLEEKLTKIRKIRERLENESRELVRGPFDCVFPSWQLDLFYRGNGSSFPKFVLYCWPPPISKFLQEELKKGRTLQELGITEEQAEMIIKFDKINTGIHLCNMIESRLKLGERFFEIYDNHKKEIIMEDPLYKKLKEFSYLSRYSEKKRKIFNSLLEKLENRTMKGMGYGLLLNSPRFFISSLLSPLSWYLREQSRVY